jgi:hypothetical protein
VEAATFQRHLFISCIYVKSNGLFYLDFLPVASTSLYNATGLVECEGYFISGGLGREMRSWLLEYLMRYITAQVEYWYNRWWRPCDTFQFVYPFWKQMTQYVLPLPPGGSLCMSVLPHVRSNFCGLGVCAGTNRPPETSTPPQWAPSIYFSENFWYKGYEFSRLSPPGSTPVHLSSRSSRLIAILSCP